MEGLKPGVIANVAVSNVAFHTSDFAYVIYEVCGDTLKLVPASSAPLLGCRYAAGRLETTGHLAGCNGPAGRIRPRTGAKPGHKLNGVLSTKQRGHQVLLTRMNSVLHCILQILS